jgi:hypothetical protein
MSHRTAWDDRERVRRAVHPEHITDDNRAMTESALRAIAEGRYLGDPSRSTAASRLGRESATADPAESAALAARLARESVTGAALAIPCREHDAAPGAYCYRGARGVCSARLERRPRHA